MRIFSPMLLALGLAVALGASAAELHPPSHVTAGTAFSIASGGSGHATFYLVGPAQASKREVDLGSNIAVQGDEVEHAGRYTAIACSGSDCTASNFYVNPAEPARLSLLVHPSRVPASAAGAISAVAFVFDTFHNLVISPTNVIFNVTPKDGATISQAHTAQNGVAWIRMTSARKEGPTKVGASIGKVAEVRVVQQVASEACNLRIRSEWVSHQLMVETDPVRDCSGNAVPDGTVVSFTKIDPNGKTTVDVPIKRGVAKVQMPIVGSAHITVASGVATGNELELAGGQ